MSKLLNATFGSPDRPLVIAGIEIPCYVLEDEKRVITQRGLFKAIGISPGSSANTSGDRLAKFIEQPRFNKFLSPEVRVMTTNPIKFKTQKSGNVFGYEATVLVDICDMVLQAHKAGLLLKQQYHIAEHAEALIRALAKTGIIALVDEATGYQKSREEDALQRFLQKFLDEEKGKWVRTFPPEFFESIFKMKGWTWKEASTKKPQVVGHYINNYVYSRLAPKILDELRERAPKDEKGNRKGKFPQWINPEFGHPILKERLTILTAFARASGFNWNNWERMVNRAFPKFDKDGSQSPELPFND